MTNSNNPLISIVTPTYNRANYIENTKDYDTMKLIEKYIFIGVGLGIHIELTHKKIKSEEYFIIEDDLELAELVASEARDKYHGAFNVHNRITTNP